MGPIILIVVLALLGWLAVIAVRSLRARGVGWPWWAALVGCVVAGFALGVWFGFCFEYQPSSTFRVIGFPLPSACFVHKTDVDGVERWIDYPSLPNALADILLFSSISIYSIWLVNTLWRSVHGRGKMPLPTDAT